MATIKVKGIPVCIDSKNDLRALRNNAPELYHAIYTANEDLIKWAYELYLDELDAQDAKASTGSYGKHAEVYARVNDALENHKRIWLHDIRCRRPGMDDHRAAGIRYEYKTGFAQWAYGTSYQHSLQDCITGILESCRRTDRIVQVDQVQHSSFVPQQLYGR